MFKLHVIMNVGLFMLPLLHVEEQMILQHLEIAIQSDNSKNASHKVCYQ